MDIGEIFKEKKEFFGEKWDLQAQKGSFGEKKLKTLFQMKIFNQKFRK